MIIESYSRHLRDNHTGLSIQGLPLRYGTPALPHAKSTEMLAEFAAVPKQSNSELLVEDSVARQNVGGDS